MFFFFKQFIWCISKNQFYVDKNLLANFFSIESKTLHNHAVFVFTMPKSDAWIQTQRNYLNQVQYHYR